MQNENTVILPIKRVYFNQILAGEKVYEYRRKCRFYDTRLAKNPKHIILHYYKKPRLTADIVSIKSVLAPKKLQALGFGKRVWRIELTNVKHHLHQ